MKKIILTVAILACGNIVWANTAQMYKLDNGQTVVVQQVKSNPIVTIDTWIKTGSIDETDSNNGVAHFLEHLFFKGTQNHATGEFDKILETKGAITNAATSKDFTHYYITIPSKDFDLAIALHADMLQHPLIPRNEMEKERKVVLEEISKDMNSPSKILQENLNNMMYTTHPYKRKVIGKSEVIETITRDQVLAFYNEHYSPSNMVTIVVGDVAPAHAVEKIKEVFNSEYKKPVKNVYTKENQLTTQLKKVDYIKNTESGYIIIGFRGTPIDEKDSYALDILATVLGDGRSSVLNQVLKEKMRIAFSVEAGNSTFRDDGLFYITADFEPDKCKAVQDSIFNEIKRIQENGITDEQLNLAKNIIERTTYYSRESVTNIATEIGYTISLTNDMKFYDSYLDNIKEVTKDEVKKAAQKYLGQNKSAISIVLPESSKDLPVSNVTKNTGTADLISENAQTQKYKLSEGATMLYTPNSSNDIIAISIYSKGGQLLEKTHGTSSLVASVMMKGTKNYSSLELSQQLEDNGIKISPVSGADSFAISVLTTKDEYDKTMELLNEIINNATFDEYEINKVKSDKLNSIKRNKYVPIQRAIEEYRDLIYKNTPYSISANVLEKNIPNITQAEMIEYYNKVFDPKNTIISINGNINKEKAIKDFNKIFQAKNNSEVFDYTKYTTKIPTPETSRVTVQNMPSTQTAWIMLGWQTCGVLNQKDYATLQVIDSILGTGMSSRLFKDLREQEGLAYQLGTSYSPNILKGSFLLYIGTNPDTLEKSKEGLFNEIKRLKTEYVGDKELKDAKEKLLGNYVIGLETNLDKASNIGWYEASGREYQFKDNYDKLINSVTDSDIIEVANKYFTDNYILSVVTK